ncbi:MAG: single-stranded-DNA-specific exonuclease RecJ [Bacteroidetes bacterium]|nr:single-stranded-DNA-specific exonuclease RecJ [Bacteroidota bacterium]MCH8525327.1 single-stranded-DNA-specific exonuclease RecJ [Balneolales bacterium]
MSFRWVFTQPEDGDAVVHLEQALFSSNGSAKAKKLSSEAGLTLARLLALRGVTTYDSARHFFRPDLTALHDPFLMKDMHKASVRLARAIRNQEKVVVYGDYDVDGTTATAIVYSFLKRFGVDVSHYIPHRFKEGYGISEDGIQFAINSKSDLIVSVDCGITAVEEAKFAKEKGIDLVICDHHNAGDEIPDAVAVLDPKRPDCDYPFDGLSGAGVGFKLVQATLSKLGLPQDEAYKFLDLVAISIASDIVPIVDENRILMREGLKLLNESPRVGIKALMNLIKMDIGKVSTSNIVFSIGPRINAAGRMGDAGTAMQLLIAESYEEASKFAAELEAINQKRRKTDTKTMEQAMIQIDERVNMSTCASVVLHHPEWHLGVIGIVASRLVDQYCRPAVMLSTVDGKIKGSARSVKGFNIYNALKECEDLLIQFGGHEFAAGLTMEESKLDEFRERFNQIVRERMCDEDFKPELSIDAEIELSYIDAQFWKVLSQFEPFGPLNTKPVFVSKGVQVVGNPIIVGRDHLKLRVMQNGSYAFDAIGFNLGSHLEDVRSCQNGCLEMAFTIDENTWRNRTSLQLQVLDLRVN